MIGAKMRILRALLKGRKLTAFEADKVGKTHEGGRRIRELRVTYPILKEKVRGKNYVRYYLDPEYIKEYRQKNRLVRILENAKTLFV